MMKNRLTNIFFWGIISAAFIGPGTITTAASAGAGFGYSLVWALVFSTIACIVLQEASARLRLVIGENLGEVLNLYFRDKKGGRAIVFLVAGSVIFGCAAYEAGNILGAIAGVSLVFHVNPVVFTLSIGLIAAVLLWFSSVRMIAQMMGMMVAFMGLCFVGAAVILQPSVKDIFMGSIIPSLPQNAEVIILGLIGTTVVPYNLFLGSGLSHKQSLREMRMSLSLAIILGGVVSIAVLIVGTSVSGVFSFEGLANALQLRLGSWAVYLLGFGLLAAGISSALTAPLAAAITAKSLWPQDNENTVQPHKETRYRSTWSIVLATGIVFGVLRVQPISAIILAQALNGIILPIVAIFLLLMANNVSLLGPLHINGKIHNVVMSVVVFLTILLGVKNVLQAIFKIFNSSPADEKWMLGFAILVSLVCFWPLSRTIKKLRKVSG